MIVITTPTGDIGSQVLDALLDSGEKLRVVVRDPSALPDRVRERVDVVRGSHRHTDVVDRAFTGADAVFWLVPPDRRAPSLVDAYVGFSEAAAKALVTHGVGRVVGISALGRGTAYAGRAGLVTASLAMDDLMASTGVAYRALANAGFMDNVLRQVDSIRTDGVFTDIVDADRARPLVATRDIAATAAHLLRDESWTGVDEVPLLGPEHLSQNDLAAVMSDVLGRPVRYERQAVADFEAAMVAYGTGAAFVHGLVEMMAAKDDGLDDGVPRTPDTTSPTTFRQWCTDVLLPRVRTGSA